RRRVLSGARLYERLTLTNFSDRRAEVPVRFTFAADYADLFEVQGHSRAAHGQHLKPEVKGSEVCLAYRGLDGLVRNTALKFSRAPHQLTDSTAEFLFDLDRGAVEALYVEIGPIQVDEQPLQQRYDHASNLCAQSAEKRLTASAFVQTSGHLFNQWIDRSRADLAL